MAGSITSIGIGSGLDLQNILDQLREADETVVTRKKDEISGLQEKIDAYHSVNAKLYSIKSSALDLSLESNFLSNTVTVTDESVASATIGDGYEPASYSLQVNQMAKKSSWASAEISSKSDNMVAEPSAGFAKVDTQALTEDKTLTLYYGEYQGEKTDNAVAAGTTDASFAINGVAIGAVTVLDGDSDGALVDAINAGTDDHGVTASVDGDGKLILQSRDHEPIDITMDAATQAVFGGGTLSDMGERQSFNVSLTTGMSLSEVADEINNLASNTDGQGGTIFTATTVLGDDGNYYIRIYDSNGGDTAESEIMVDSDLEWIAADKTVTIGQGEKSMVVSVPPGASYQDMVGLINDHEKNPGVTAKIIDNGKVDNPYQFVLSADDTGEEARISLSNLSALSEVTGKDESLNAIFEVDGVTYNRQSNTGINDVITGMTLELKKAGADATTSLNVQSNLDDVKEDITTMINGFNDLVAFINGKDDAGDDSEDESEEDTTSPLEDETSANRIVSQLKGLVTSVIYLDSDYTSLTDLGLTVSRDGSISLDETKLEQALANDPEAVKALFIGDPEKEVEGLGDLFNDAISEMVSSTGISSTEIDEGEAKIDRLEEDITSQTARLDKKYETMSAQFAWMDSYINRLNSEANALTSMINSLNGNSKK